MVPGTPQSLSSSPSDSRESFGRSSGRRRCCWRWSRRPSMPIPGSRHRKTWPRSWTSSTGTWAARH